MSQLLMEKVAKNRLMRELDSGNEKVIKEFAKRTGKLFVPKDPSNKINEIQKKQDYY